jgi:hypothetical protein
MLRASGSRAATYVVRDSGNETERGLPQRIVELVGGIRGPYSVACCLRSDDR